MRFKFSFNMNMFYSRVNSYKTWQWATMRHDSSFTWISLVIKYLTNTHTMAILGGWSVTTQNRDSCIWDHTFWWYQRWKINVPCVLVLCVAATQSNIFMLRLKLVCISCNVFRKRILTSKTLDLVSHHNKAYSFTTLWRGYVNYS